jgi:O-antigen/teichoic acid export membrane protein
MKPRASTGGRLVAKFAPRGELRRILGNIAWLWSDRLFSMALGLVVGILVARYLGPALLGLLSFAAAFVALFSALPLLGLRSIVVREIVRDRAAAGEILGTAMVLIAVGGVLATVAVNVVIGFLRFEDTTSRVLVAILSSSLLWKCFQVTELWFESQVHSRPVVWLKNAVLTTFAPVTLALIWWQAPVTAFAWANAAQAALLAAGLAWLLLRQRVSLGGLSVVWSRALALLANSWPLLLSSVAIVIYMKIDQVMLGEMLDAEAVGVYAVAAKLSEAWYFIATAIVASVFPAILRAKRRSLGLYHRRVQRLYDLMVALGIGVGLVITLLAGPVIDILYGKAYQSSAEILKVHVWAGVFVFLGSASGKWLLAENLQRLSLQRTLSGAVANVLGNLILIPLYGAVGAAWATLLSYAVAGMFFDVFQRRTRLMWRMKLRAFNPLQSVKRMLEGSR